MPLSIRADAYLELIEWTARLIRPGRRGVISENVPPVLNQLGLRERQWQFQVRGIESRNFRAIGCAEALMQKAHAMGQCWLKGLGTAQQLIKPMA